jgi:hypothetical protein
VWAELLKTGLALLTVTVGVNQAADCCKVAGLETRDFGADFGDTTDDLMSGNAWIDSGYPTPLVTDLVEVRMADTAKKGFRSERRVRPGRAAGSWWGQAVNLHWQQNRPPLYTYHVIQI